MLLCVTAVTCFCLCTFCAIPIHPYTTSVENLLIVEGYVKWPACLKLTYCHLNTAEKSCGGERVNSKPVQLIIGTVTVIIDAVI